MTERSTVTGGRSGAAYIASGRSPRGGFEASGWGGTRPDGRTRDEEDDLHRAARVEEMVARTHERAAELYEAWSGRHDVAAASDFHQRARRHRELAAASRSVERLAERTLNAFEARVHVGSGRTGKAQHLAVLTALGCLRALIERRVAATVETGRREAATWAEIAAALGVTRQTAHQRYRHGSE